MRRFLLIEDCEDDAFFFEHALRKAGYDAEVTRVHDGVAAIEYLYRCGEQGLEKPDLIFLDLKMPRLSGFSVLRWLQRMPLEYQIPVLVLSSSVEPNDRAEAQALGANGYIEKPLSATQFSDVLNRLSNEFFCLTQDVPTRA